MDLAEFDREHQKLLVMFREQKEELERSNRWAEELNALLAARGARIDELQEELARDQENARRVVAGYNAKVAALEQEGREKTQWAHRYRNPPHRAKFGKIADALTATAASLEQTEKDLQERTALGAAAGRRKTPTRRPAEYGARLPMDQAGAQGRPRPRALTWLS